MDVSQRLDRCSAALCTDGEKCHGRRNAQPEAVFLPGWGQSGFANTDLDAQLKQRGLEKLILVGLVANTCVESTARFCMELGCHVTLIKDATAAFSPEGLHAVRVVHGRMTTTAASPSAHSPKTRCGTTSRSTG